MTISTAIWISEQIFHLASNLWSDYDAQPFRSLSFSSSTGSTITKHCYDDLNNFAGDQKLLPRYDEIRRSISREFGVEGANIVLGSSGTHLEVLSNLFEAEHESSEYNVYFG